MHLYIYKIQNFLQPFISTKFLILINLKITVENTFNEILKQMT